MQGEKMIELDKSFVEERRRKEKEKIDNFQKEAMKDYKDYYAKKDVKSRLHRKIGPITKEPKLKTETNFRSD